jgi:hypothetical protein
MDGMKRALSFGLSPVVLAVALSGCSGSESEPAERRVVSPPPAHGAAASQKPARRLPPYNESAEAARPFPELMPAERYRRAPVVQEAYEIAHRIPEVLAQQPCFCYCDKFGHGSLLDCWASDHGAG